MRLLPILAFALLAGCASSPPRHAAATKAVPQKTDTAKAGAGNHGLGAIEASGSGREVVMYALGLLDVGYQFGGKNPEAGLDCSGMVSFIYRNALGMDIRGSAADLAKRGRAVAASDIQAGDLVFFNTLGRSFSHVGIYIGDQKFIHAPSSHGKIRIESMNNSYFASRFQLAKSLL